MLKVAVRGLFARRLRLALTALAVTLGVTLMAGTYVFTDTFTSSFDKIFQTAFAGTDVVITPSDEFESGDGQTAPLDASLLTAVKGVEGVRDAEGSIFALGVLFLDKDGERIGGQSPSFLAGTYRNPTFDAFDVETGRQPQRPGEIAIDKATADRKGFEVGDTIDVQGEAPRQSFDIVGIVTFAGVDNFGGGSVGIMIPAEAQRVAGLEGRFTEIDIDGEDDVSPDELRAAVAAQPEIAARIRAGALNVRTGQQEADEQTASLQEDLGALRTALLVFAGIALFVGAFSIFNTFSITVAQRARELALLRTLGASRGQVLRSVLAEGLAIGVVGSVIGVALGLLVAEGLHALFKAIGFELPSSGTVLETRTIVVSLAVGILITLVATLSPALRATRVAPVEALRTAEAPARTRLSGRRIAIATVVTALGVAAMVLGLFAVSDDTGALSLMGAGAAFTFLGVALLSPLFVGPLASLLGRPLQRLHGVTGRLARENTTRQPQRTAVTAAALMVGVALVTFASVFASSARSTFSDAVDRGIRGEIVVQNTDGFSSFSTEVRKRLGTVDGVAAVGGVRFVEIAFAGIDGQKAVVGIDPATLQETFDAQDVQPSLDVVDRLAGRQIVIARDLAEEQGIEIGETIGARGPRGPFELEVVGTIDDTTGLTGDGMLPNALVAEQFAVDKDNYLFVKLDDGADPAAVQRAVRTTLSDDFPQVEVLTADEWKQTQVDQINQLLAIIYALLALAVIVAIFGIVNTLVLAVTERTRELGLLRAVGMTRRQVRRVIRYEAVITALIGAVLGTVMGLVLSVLVSRAIEDFQLAIPVVGILVVLVLAGVVGVLAAIVPARRASRLDVLESLSYE